MRAKLIKEKFTEDSDPVTDMGIGASAIIKDWEKKIRDLDRKIVKENNIQFAIGNNLNSFVDSTGIIWDIFLHKNSLVIRTGSWSYYTNKKPINTGNYINNILDTLKLSSFVELKCLSSSIIISSTGDSYLSRGGTDSEYYNIKIKPEYLKYFKNTINEKFTEDSDPIKDMGIGMYNRNFKSPDELMKAFFSNLSLVFEGENMSWNTDEQIKDNILELYERENHKRKYFYDKIGGFKDKYKWTLHGEKYNHWYTAFNTYFIIKYGIDLNL